MADDVTEQVAATEEQPGGVEEQGFPVAGDADLAVADPAESVAGDEVPLEWESLLTSDDGIAKLAERFPTLRGRLEAERKNGENTARQRLENEWRREQGSVRHAAQVQEMWANKYGIELDEEDSQGLPLLMRPVESYVRREIGGQILGAALDHFSIEERQLLERMASEYDGDPDKFLGFASEAVQAVYEKGRRATLAGSLSDVPDGSPLRKEIDAHIAERVKQELASELEAQQEEAKQDFRQRNRPPSTQRGRTPAATNRNRYLSMSAQDIARLPAEEYEAAKRVLAGID